jgi:hypothetical protein
MSYFNFFSKTALAIAVYSREQFSESQKLQIRELAQAGWRRRFETEVESQAPSQCSPRQLKWTEKQTRNVF